LLYRAFTLVLTVFQATIAEQTASIAANTMLTEQDKHAISPIEFKINLLRSAVPTEDPNKQSVILARSNVLKPGVV